MKYGYVRVSSTTQSVDRQVDEMHKMGLKDFEIFIDKQSGKDFDRPNYQILKDKLNKEDLLIIKSIDRLGRDYDMIIEEWSNITKKIEADIFVIDMPILDTRVDNHNLVGKFIGDIVLQILSFVAQTERENIKQRQAEGIRIAKQKGVHLGRPQCKLPHNFKDVVADYKSKKITNTQAAKILNISRGTFLKYTKSLKDN